jgi:hypothetical protein
MIKNNWNQESGIRNQKMRRGRRNFRALKIQSYEASELWSFRALELWSFRALKLQSS